MFENYISNRFFILYLIPFVIGSLSVLSFQPFNFTIINFLILPIFFYSVIYIKKKSKSTYRKKPYKKNLFIFGTLFGFGYFLSGIYWITNSLTFDESFKYLIPFALIIIPLFLSLFFSVITVLVAPFLSMNFTSLLLISSSFSISDFLRSKILTGFPWNLWSYSFSWATELLQILNILGLYAFNLIVITFFFLPIILFFRISLFKKIFTFSISILLGFTFYIYGNYAINQNQSNSSLIKNYFEIKIISPNFELEYGLSKKQIKERLEKLIRYSDPIGTSKTLFIWPEGVFSGFNYEEIVFLKKIFLDNFHENHFILFGVSKANSSKSGVYNTLVVVDNNMKIIREYRKQKLVPFGEFLPIEKQLNKFGLKKITEGYGSFLKGENQKNLVFDNLNILPLICYEIIFTKFVQNSEEDTNLIINISEDGWFGNSIGPHQHFAKAIFRAIEQNTYVLRSANKGISAIINNKGEIEKMLKPDEVGSIELNVPLMNNKNKNKNDLIFLVLLFTNIFIFTFYKKNNVK